MALTLKKAARARKPLESSFEESFAEALRRAGVESWHVTARDPGWPDRFCATGDWIEFKVLTGDFGNDQLEPEQRGRMRQLAAAGVRVWYVAWHEGRVIIYRYPPAKPMYVTAFHTAAGAIDGARQQGGFICG